MTSRFKRLRISLVAVLVAVFMLSAAAVASSVIAHVTAIGAETSTTGHQLVLTRPDATAAEDNSQFQAPDF